MHSKLFFLIWVECLFCELVRICFVCIWNFSLTSCHTTPKRWSKRLTLEFKSTLYTDEMPAPSFRISLIQTQINKRLSLISKRRVVQPQLDPQKFTHFKIRGGEAVRSAEYESWVHRRATLCLKFRQIMRQVIIWVWPSDHSVMRKKREKETKKETDSARSIPNSTRRRRREAWDWCYLRRRMKTAPRHRLVTRGHRGCRL